MGKIHLIKNRMREIIIQTISPFWRVSFGAIGALVALLHPTWPFIIICTLAVLLDCYTAWALSRRVKKYHPGANDGKFKSRYFGKIFETLIKIYLLIILSHLIEIFIFEGVHIRLANISAGAVCFWQIWSMLENESSCNDARWAKVAQKIMIDKAERHFDIDLSELKNISHERETKLKQSNDTTRKTRSKGEGSGENLHVDKA